jgi:hypothetical protein
MPTRPPAMGADVEIIEQVSGDSAKLSCIKPTLVRVNGVDVGLIEKDSLQVDPGDGLTRPATVSLTLLPRSITIRAENASRLADILDQEVGIGDFESRQIDRLNS